MQETPASAHLKALADKIRAKTARVGVVGLGYVGLPLAVEYAKAGYTVTGIDLQPAKVDALNRGESYIQDVPTHEVKSLVAAGKLTATSDFSVISTLDTINICVPTPLRKTKDPDMSYIVSACEEIAKYFHPGMLVILESTTYPGTTDELVRPMLERDGLRVGEDFFLCFSPERVDPGNPKFQTKNIPKVVGGTTPACTRNGRAVLLAGSGDSGSGQLDAGGRDGEAAREHLPHDQHRPGERARDHVRPHGNQRVGSDRRGGHQAVRVHAVLSRARAWAGTAFRSIRSTCRGRASRQASRRGLSSWPDTSTGRCRILSSTKFRMH